MNDFWVWSLLLHISNPLVCIYLELNLSKQAIHVCSYCKQCIVESHSNLLFLSIHYKEKLNYYLNHRHLDTQNDGYTKASHTFFFLLFVEGSFTSRTIYLFGHNNLWNIIFACEWRGSALWPLRMLDTFCSLLFAWAAAEQRLRALIMGFILMKRK